MTVVIHSIMEYSAGEGKPTEAPVMGAASETGGSALSRFEWRWRHETVTDPLPAYLQPVHTIGPVRFDPMLRTAGEIMQARRAACLPEKSGVDESVDDQGVYTRNSPDRHAA